MAKRIDILIKGGTIVDGRGSEPFEGDLGIVGDKIAFVQGHKNLPGGTSTVNAQKIVEARDLIVAPGFIDTHGHSEFTLLADPRGEGKIRQGITTEINGNCGLSAAPLYGEALRQREEDLKECGIRERWTTFREYFELLERRGLSLNFVTLAGHGNIRASVAGYKDKKMTDTELKKMGMLLKEAIKEGALGLSTGLIYPPGVYSDTRELISLCKVLANSGKGASRIYTSHMRSEGDKLIESIGETIEIAKESGIKGHISHIKTSGEKNWHKIDEAISSISKARNEGTAITADRYPYTAASTDLDTVLPAWVYEGGAGEEIKKLNNGDLRERIRREILSDHPDMKYWEHTYVSSVASGKNKWMEGLSVAAIASQEGSEPTDVVFKILIEERLRAGAIFSSMSEANLKRFLSLPYVMVGSDSSARSASGVTCKGKPHPRGFGSFPRFLGRYVRDDSLMGLSEAVRKMTLLPAETFGIHRRGILTKGAFADIVVFDYKKIEDKATYSQPFMRPEGIRCVIVKGLPAVWEGELTGLQCGRVLKHGKT